MQMLAEIPNIHIATSKSHTGPVEADLVTWTFLCKRLDKVLPGVKEGPGYVAANLPDGRRTNNRVITTSLLVFDIDNKANTVTQASLEKVVRDNGYKAILHSTYSHTPENPRFRLILAISKPIEPDDHKSVLTHVSQKLGISDFIDKACADISRYFYLPRCPKERVKDFVFWSNDGNPVNVEVYLNRIKFACPSPDLPLIIAKTNKPISNTSRSVYGKLTRHSLESILAFIDHTVELIWTQTCNALARVYGEEGRLFFQSYSAGEYAAIGYANYDADECNARFDRALSELKDRPDGYGIKHLLQLARSNPSWSEINLEFEEINPSPSLALTTDIPDLTKVSMGSPQVLNMADLSSDKQISEVNGLLVIQARFALSQIGGELRVIDLEQVTDIQNGRGDTNLNLYKLTDAKILMLRHLSGRHIITTKKDDLKSFYMDRNTTVFKTICFRPGKSRTDELNLWAEPPLRPQKGDWTLIRSHIYTIICDSDDEKYEYLLGFLAHMLQFPKEKPGVMIVLSSGQGTGKGALFNVIQRIWQTTALFASRIDSVVGQFNSALERSYVVLLDEALFSGDRKAQDCMKSLITERVCRVEAKYQPSRQVESIHRFFATTNHEQFGSTASDDRRHAFFRVSEWRRGDGAYFSDLFKSIEDDNIISALIYDLLHHDLTEFDVRDRPITKDRAEQVLKSLTGFENYWYQVLDSELIDPYGDGFAKYNGGFVPSSIFAKESNRLFTNKPLSYGEIKKCIAILCPSAQSVCRKANKKSTQQRGYDFPPIDIARDEFAHALDVNIKWGDDG